VSFWADRKEVAPGKSVPELVRAYAEAEAKIRSGFAQVAEAQHLLDGTFAMNSYGVSFRTSGGRSEINFEKPDDTLRELRRGVWSCLIERMQIRKAMSIAAWKELQNSIERGEPPPITEEIVQGMIDKFRQDIPSMVEAAVHEVFDFLRPRCSEYKTNTEFELGERVILKWVLGQRWDRRSKWSVDYDYEQNLIALENVFRWMDGTVVVSEQRHYSDLSTAIKACSPEKCHGATAYFEFKGFNNRTLHLKFRRMDLVAKLNRVAGGMRLKPEDVKAA
jgi:hypothetical protein